MWDLSPGVVVSSTRPCSIREPGYCLGGHRGARLSPGGIGEVTWARRCRGDRRWRRRSTGRAASSPGAAPRRAAGPRRDRALPHQRPRLAAVRHRDAATGRGDRRGAGPARPARPGRHRRRRRRTCCAGWPCSAPTYLAAGCGCARSNSPRARPSLPAEIGWSTEPPAPGSTTGVVLATEWLDNVPLDMAEVDEDGLLRYRAGRAADRRTSTAGDAGHRRRRRLGRALVRRGAARAGRPGRAGRPRATPRGPARSADSSAASPSPSTMDTCGTPGRYAGTLTGFYAGRSARRAVPDGSRDITAHVAIDAVVRGRRGGRRQDRPR